MIPILATETWPDVIELAIFCAMVISVTWIQNRKK